MEDRVSVTAKSSKEKSRKLNRSESQRTGKMPSDTAGISLVIPRKAAITGRGYWGSNLQTRARGLWEILKGSLSLELQTC